MAENWISRYVNVCNEAKSTNEIVFPSYVFVRLFLRISPKENLFENLYSRSLAFFFLIFWKKKKERRKYKYIDPVDLGAIMIKYSNIIITGISGAI